MPFCPKCRDEFQDWVEVCPDCKSKLVDKLSPKKKPAKKRGNTSLYKGKPNELKNLPKSLDDFYNSPGTRGF
jgi:hypothetical protein